MGSVRPCGCKGCRTCLLCEDLYGIEKKDFYKLYKDREAYVWCPSCNLLQKGWNTTDVLNDHQNHKFEHGLQYPGVLVQPNFITSEEGTQLMKNLDDIPWQGSQSGRRKQNFGPKTNFKKRKLQLGNFNGFPQFSEYIQKRFETVPLLKNFQSIEQCTLEYEPTKGACIDPHIDDCWIWGERVVTVNCLGDSVLTLVPYVGDTSKYNLDLVDSYRRKLICDYLDEKTLNIFRNIVIRIPMPNLSLIVLYGPARYQFEHSVLREDVTHRRVCIAYREFTPMYLENGESKEKGKPITIKAQNFWDHTNC